MATAEDPGRKPTSTRGGARKGAGVKAADGVATKRVNLTLDAATLAVFAALGDGNVSRGAREAARLAQGQPPSAAAATAPSPPGYAGQHRGTDPGGM